MDVTTKKLVDKIDRSATYLNCATTGFLLRGATPVYLDTERQMMELMFRSLGSKPASSVRLIQIPNTLHLTECLASEALLPELHGLENVEIIGEAKAMTFDAQGNLCCKIGRKERA